MILFYDCWISSKCPKFCEAVTETLKAANTCAMIDLVAYEALKKRVGDLVKKIEDKVTVSFNEVRDQHGTFYGRITLYKKGKAFDDNLARISFQEVWKVLDYSKSTDDFVAVEMERGGEA